MNNKKIKIVTEYIKYYNCFWCIVIKEIKFSLKMRFPVTGMHKTLKINMESQKHKKWIILQGLWLSMSIIIDTLCKQYIIIYTYSTKQHALILSTLQCIDVSVVFHGQTQNYMKHVPIIPKVVTLKYTQWHQPFWPE